jgi:hypothetical protein
MKIKVITSYKPGTWNDYADRCVRSVLEHWPEGIAVNVYYEDREPDNSFHPRKKYINLHQVQPDLIAFKEKHKNDPVANGELKAIEGGVRRPAEFNGSDKNKGSYLFDAVRFANKVFCVTHAVRTSVEKDYDYIIWLDADTYTFRPMPRNFLESLLPTDSMLTYLGRENPVKNDGGKYPECGFVGYNLRHPQIQNFVNDWEKIYTTDAVFDLIEWHDSYVFWHLSKLYRQQHSIKVNDIGYWKGVKGHHVFINSELGLYMDHFKGKRKNLGSSARNDLRTPPTGAPANVLDIEYWKKVPGTWR